MWYLSLSCYQKTARHFVSFLTDATVKIERMESVEDENGKELEQMRVEIVEDDKGVQSMHKPMIEIVEDDKGVQSMHKPMIERVENVEDESRKKPEQRRVESVEDENGELSRQRHYGLEQTRIQT